MLLDLSIKIAKETFVVQQVIDKWMSHQMISNTFTSIPLICLQLYNFRINKKIIYLYIFFLYFSFPLLSLSKILWHCEMSSYDIKQTINDQNCWTRFCSHQNGEKVIYFEMACHQFPYHQLSKCSAGVYECRPIQWYLSPLRKFIVDCFAWYRSQRFIRITIRNGIKIFIYNDFNLSDKFILLFTIKWVVSHNI